MIETRQKTYKKPKSEGCHCSDPKPDGSCCNLICFERPNYFCGHLLTDTDLSKEQQYVIEKHKLYNRTLHGWGVVCGLRLTCADQECCGSIVIDEGYAIDDCGNDLVVCEPLRFDVVSLLKEKGWVVGDAVYDPCAPEDKEDECEYTQCFYVTVCYDEEARDFTTPFVAGCRPTLTECEPTRIREGVRFDVVDKLPEESEWLKDLINRLRGCFSIFTTGPFATALNDDVKKGLLGRVCANPDNIEGNEFDDLKNLFCELRGLLLLYLNKHPDKYNCKLADEIRRNTFPEPDNYYYNADFGQKAKEAFSSLLRLAFQHAISCALGELVPRCPGSKHAGCVVLGTVEVKGGCVTHVCNCPRKYVWSFANFFQVLLATLFGGIACEEKEAMPASPISPITPGRPSTYPPNYPGRPPTYPSPHYPGRGDEEEEHERHVCCTDFDASCEEILRLINVNRRFLEYAGTETARAFSSMASSVRSVFNFTDARMFSPSMFLDMNQTELNHAVNYLGIKDVRYKKVAGPQATYRPSNLFDRIGLMSMSSNETLFAELDDNNIVVNAYTMAPSEQIEGSKDLYTRVQNAEAAANEAKSLAQRLEGQLNAYIGKGTAGSESTMQDFRRRIYEEVERTSSPEKRTRTTKKRSSKGSPPQGS